MSIIDGPTLRALREQHQVSIREVAKLTGMSHGHLSKLERGGPGRPVTPKVLAAYQRATGVTLAQGEPSDHPGGWQPGQLGDKARRAFTGRIAAVAWGAALEGTIGQVIATKCRLPVPKTVDADQVTQLADVATVLTSLDGPLPGLVARVVLGWAVDLLDQAAAPERTRADLYAVIGQLARRAARAGVVVGSHEVARNLQLVAVHAAARADAADLRAQVIGDIATHLHTLEHYAASQEVVRLGEIDERVTDETRKRLHALRTSAADAEQRLVATVRQAVDADAGQGTS